MTAAVIIAAGDPDAYTTTERSDAQALSDAAVAWFGLANLPCGSYDRIIALSVAAASTLGVPADSVAWRTAVFPIGSGYPWLRSGGASGILTTLAWARIDDEMTYTGGVLELRDDDGSALTMPNDAGSIVIHDVTRPWRFSAVTAGVCRIVQFLGMRAGGNPGPGGPYVPPVAGICW